ncbi:MAG: hypothetical protein MJ102_05185 [Clostridia bacterium]|nr:hypothetical protein [Clostridia bacterium]
MSKKSELFDCYEGCCGDMDEGYGTHAISGEECAFCGRRIPEGEEFCEDAEGSSMCKNCVNEMEIDEILRVCEMNGTIELLRELGMTRHAV